MRAVPALILLTLATASAAAGDDASPDRLLAGRQAGPPRQCISQFQAQRSRIFDSGSILYRTRSGGGGTWYLNTPTDCSQLRSARAIVSRTPSGQICRGDIIAVTDPRTGFGFGSCPLGDFIPYARAPR